MEISWAAIGLAAFANMVIGMIWYAPPVFGNIWMKEAGIKMDKDAKSSDMFGPMVINFIATLVMTYVINYLMINLPAMDLGGTLMTFGWIWLGVICVTMLNRVLWEKSSVKLYILNAAYWLVAYLVMTTIVYYMA